MKIALPTRGNLIDDHFGHCESYTIFTIDENDQIAGKEIIPAITGCGCKSDIAAVLKEKGVEIMLAGNMGDGALNVLQGHDIAVFRGCRGDVTDVTMSFLRGELNDSGESCGHHHGGNSNGSHQAGGCQGNGSHGQGHGGGSDSGHGGHGHGGGSGSGQGDGSDSGHSGHGHGHGAGGGQGGGSGHGGHGGGEGHGGGGGRHSNS